MTADRYSDEALRANLTAPAAGLRHEAEILLRVPFHVRAEIVTVALFERRVAGDLVWSQALALAVRWWREGRLSEIRDRQERHLLEIHRTDCKWGPRYCERCRLAEGVMV